MGRFDSVRRVLWEFRRGGYFPFSLMHTEQKPAGARAMAASAPILMMAIPLLSLVALADNFGANRLEYFKK